MERAPRFESEQTRDAVAQVLDYGSFLETLTNDDLITLITSQSDGEGIEDFRDGEAFEEWYNEHKPCARDQTCRQRLSPNGAPPSSFAAHTALSSPSPGLNDAAASTHSTPRGRRHCAVSSYMYTDFTVRARAWCRSWRPRPAVCPTHTKFAALKLMPSCLGSTKVSTSHGR